MENPASATGFFHAVMLGLGGALVALIAAQFFPSIIPARASAVKL